MIPAARTRLIARWGLLGVAVALGLTLSGAMLYGYLASSSLATTLTSGQAETFSRLLRTRLHPESGAPTRADLQAVLEAGRPDGLRYVALVDFEGHVSVAVGEPVRAAELQPPPPPAVVVPVGPRLRVASLLMRPPPPGGGPPPPPFPGGAPMPGGAPGFPGDPAAGPPMFGPPRMRDIAVLEFEPVLATRLVRGARANVVVGVLAALLLVGAAIVLSRLLVRAEAAAVAAERQQHLASLGEMSAVLAHQIRNPLAAAKGHAQLLGEQVPAGHAWRASVDETVSHLVRLEELTNDLLDFARTGTLHPEPASPAALLREAAAEVGSTRVHLDLDGAPATWPLDPGHLRQVLINLLRNALQAGPTGAVEARVATSPAGLVITVRDRGPGIPAAEQERVFEPFHTTRVQGTGLGLAVARRIVTLHGGTITAADHPDGGALFTITIPAG
jgi:two-component system, NtrC family, sensor histidine kinase HydH